MYYPMFCRWFLPRLLFDFFFFYPKPSHSRKVFSQLSGEDQVKLVTRQAKRDRGFVSTVNLKKRKKIITQAPTARSTPTFPANCGYLSSPFARRLAQLSDVTGARYSDSGCANSMAVYPPPRAALMRIFLRRRKYRPRDQVTELAGLQGSL